MSLTVSRGLTDAGRWTAVATTVAEHLDAVKEAAKSRRAMPPPPKGAIEAARRFFRYVLDGIELDQAASSRPVTGASLSEARSIPSMAGFSNLSIAVNVMRSAEAGYRDDLGQLRERIAALLETLERLQERPRDIVPDSDLNLLKRFFCELQRQGEIERDATLASQELPRSPVF
jgi:hypothetical protein